MKKILIILFICAGNFYLHAQTLTDGLMMPKGDFCTGFLYAHDSWKNYWEGSLKRDNQNLGTVTTQSITYMGIYGVTQKLNVIAQLPYVWTTATGRTWHRMEGVQDLTLGAKYQFLKMAFTDSSQFKVTALLSGTVPLTNYTPDYLPLSIGLGSKTISAGANISYAYKKNWYAGASGEYVFRSNIFLDRPAYYTDGQLFLTNEVALPNQFQFFANIGFHKANVIAELNYYQQNTLGGGDIRKQDTPFASNRMNYSKIGGLLVYYLPMVKGLALRGSAFHTIAGRNVGQSFTYTAGAVYTFHIGKPYSTK